MADLLALAERLEHVNKTLAKAASFYDLPWSDDNSVLVESAAALREAHAEIERLKDELDAQGAELDGVAAERREEWAEVEPQAWQHIDDPDVIRRSRPTMLEHLWVPLYRLLP